MDTLSQPTIIVGVRDSDAAAGALRWAAAELWRGVPERVLARLSAGADLLVLGSWLQPAFGHARSGRSSAAA
jgi:ribose 1,5-bisphosphokinase PhnN